MSIGSKQLANLQGPHLYMHVLCGFSLWPASGYNNTDVIEHPLAGNLFMIMSFDEG